MLAYLDQRNEHPKPFVWTADADLILARSHDFLNVLPAQHTSEAPPQTDKHVDCPASQLAESNGSVAKI